VVVVCFERACGVREMRGRQTLRKSVCARRVRRGTRGERDQVLNELARYPKIRVHFFRGKEIALTIS